MLNLLLIAVLVVFVVDLSGFVPEVSKMIWKWIHPNVKYVDWLIPKPFSCSLCMTWWTGLAYLLFAKEISLFLVAYLACIALLTPVIGNTILLIKDGLIWLLDELYELIIK